MWEFEKWTIAHAALMFLIFFPSLIITFCSLCMARRRNDPARRAFTFLKPALALFTLFVFLDFCGYALSIASVRLQDDRSLSSYYSNAYALIRNLRYASSEAYAVGRLAESVGDVLVFVMLVHLGIGILIAQSGKADGLAKIIKLGAYGISAVLTVIAIAVFGLRTNFYNVVYTKEYLDSFSSSTGKQYNSLRQLDFAFMVLIFVLSVGVVGQSVMVKMQTRTEQRVSMASNTFIACAALWFLRSVYYMASIAASSNISDYTKDNGFKNYYYILDVILAAVPQLILLGLVFGLGNKKLNGLWSTEQPFLANQGDGVTPWGFSYDPNQGQAPPAMVQQPIAQPHQQPAGQPEWSQHQQQFQQQQQQFQQQYQQPPQQQFQPYYPPQQQQYAAVSPVSSPHSQATSPPPHDVAMGLNHQANGTPPQTVPQPYHEKS